MNRYKLKLCKRCFTMKNIKINNELCNRCNKEFDKENAKDDIYGTNSKEKSK
jgi:hypothetical protein